MKRVAGTTLIALAIYLVVAWIVVKNTSGCWWPWTHVEFPDGTAVCISPID